MPVLNAKSEDFSFKLDRTGKPVVTTGGEHVKGIITMLLAMKPGMDEYDPERGLDINGRKNRAYTELTRDTEYEAMIRDQITKYTDLVPIDVLAIYVNNAIFVSITVSYQGTAYTVELQNQRGADEGTLNAMLVNVNDYNRR